MTTVRTPESDQTDSSTATGLVACRSFGEIRRDALDRWLKDRVDENDDPWECRWQKASRALAHRCSTPHCVETHVSLYCSFNDAAGQIDDLLSDSRVDSLAIGDIPDYGTVPPFDSLDRGTSALFRFYVRLLWGAEVFLDDLQQLLTQAGIVTNARRILSKDAPLGVDTLRAFINHIGKHGAKSTNALHCWNHHAEFLFADAGTDLLDHPDLRVLTANVTPRVNDRYEGLLMPRLADIVDTLTTALRNVDAEINNPLALDSLALAFGTCWT